MSVSVSREVALEILRVSVGACAYWGRAVVAEVDSASGRPSVVAFTDDVGVNRLASVDRVAEVAAEWAVGASGEFAGALRSGGVPDRFPAGDVDEIVQLVVFQAVRF